MAGTLYTVIFCYLPLSQIGNNGEHFFELYGSLQLIMEGAIVFHMEHHIAGLKIGLRVDFLLSIYDSNERIDFVHGKPKFLIEVLDELEHFIDKKLIFDENFFSVGSSNFVIRITFFSFQPRHFSFSG
jgi:hypothetical protein